jgi:hypothetical protein
MHETLLNSQATRQAKIEELLDKCYDTWPSQEFDEAAYLLDTLGVSKKDYKDGIKIRSIEELLDQCYGTWPSPE